MTDIRNLPAFAYRALRIVTKAGAVTPLHLNASQLALHRKVQEQHDKTGRVRVVVLKARQTGISTYFVARNYWRMRLSGDPLKAYILAHLQDAARNLMRIATRFPEYAPHPAFRPVVMRSNLTELALESGAVMEAHTASTPSSGRSGTVHLFHSSEVAFQEHGPEHLMGTRQQVPETGSEIVLESTAKGPAGIFYSEWEAAVRGESGYLPVFLPWFLEPEYSLPAPADFELSSEADSDHESEREYAARHHLTHDQMYWRRLKVQGLTFPGIDGQAAFCQEYPADPQEAFRYGRSNAFISPVWVANAYRRWVERAGDRSLDVPLILGLDSAPAHGASNTVLSYRRGARLLKQEVWQGLATQVQAEKLVTAYRESGAVAVGNDESEGTGVAIGEYARRMGVRCIGVKFGERPRRPELYANRRAELYAAIAEWLETDGQLPQDKTEPTLGQELLSVERKPGNERVLQLEGKHDVVKRGFHSPDKADSLACTFVVPDAAVAGSARATIAQTRMVTPYG